MCPRHYQARGDRAALPGVHGGGERRHRARASEICVVEHQERRLAAELQEHLLDGRGGVDHDAPARVRRSGERHHVHARVLGQQGPDTMVAGRHDVYDARGEVGVPGDQVAEHRRRPRGVRSGLENQRVSGRQGRPDLGQVDLVRKIPRRDRADHTDGLTRHRAVGGDALRRRMTEIDVPRVGLGRVGAEAQILDRAFELRACRQHALARPPRKR